MSNQGNREQEGNLDQTSKDPGNPTGTSGRQGNTGTDNGQQGNTDTNRPGGNRAHRHADDEDSGLGNRITNR